MISPDQVQKLDKFRHASCQYKLNHESLGLIVNLREGVDILSLPGLLLPKVKRKK